MSLIRLEQDSMGTVEVPIAALYGAQTQRAINNFHLSTLRMPAAFIQAIAQIKKAAAQANLENKLLSPDMAEGIVTACDAIIRGEHSDQFPVDVFQTGSGTSTNMNLNEVIAHLACATTGLKVHPNDHVNMGQSSNDTIPSAIHVSAAMALQHQLLPKLQALEECLNKKSQQLNHRVKTGRTHLMDAMPLTFGQEIGGWRSQITSNYERLNAIIPQLLRLAQGGTAVGTGVNTLPNFAARMAHYLQRNTGLAFVPGENFFALMSAQDTAVALSGNLKTLAVSLMKIANDVRWMNSGPLAGLAEISVPELQPGSSIMPGKINPVIAEAVCMVCAQVIGNDTSITIAGQSGNFQLNVMLPLIAYNLLQSIELLANACQQLGEDAIAGFTINDAALDKALAQNPILVTALNPLIGYDKAAAIAKQAYREGRAIIDVAAEQTQLSRNELMRLLNPHTLTGQ
jgi:fumarate hydratase class II